MVGGNSPYFVTVGVNMNEEKREVEGEVRDGKWKPNLFFHALRSRYILGMPRITELQSHRKHPAVRKESYSIRGKKNL